MQTCTIERQETSGLTTDEAVARGVDLLRAGELDAAEAILQDVLAAAPDHADALHFRGVLAFQRGMAQEAIDLINRSIAIDPSQPDRFNNLGNVLRQVGRSNEALKAYQRALTLCPTHARAYANLGLLLKDHGRLEDAARAYLEAITCDPELAEAYCNYGNVLVQQGKVAEGVVQYAKAMTLCPRNATTRRRIAEAYVTLGQEDRAAAVYREWLKEEPDNAAVKYMFAACLAQDVPPRAPDAYIESLFDDFAVSFDSHLARLQYKAPQLALAALRKAGIEPNKRLVALDAGCGTGLCGSLLEPYVSRLVGVDLSAKMLVRARSRNIYDELVQGELTSFLQERRAAFDVVVSADTLVYFGALETFIASAFAGLRAGGTLVFTVESVDEDAGIPGYRINPHGRYSHTRSYVANVLAVAGFEDLCIEDAELRMEAGRTVNGLIVTARKFAKAPPLRSISEALAQAIDLHRSGALDAAGLLYAQILEAAPAHPSVLHHAGILALQRGRGEEAARLIGEAVVIEPSADRYNDLGNARRRARRDESAVEAYCKAIALEPLHAGAHSNLATVLNALDRPEEAERVFERAIECDPNLPEAYNNYGNLLARQGRVQEAVVQYSKATLLSPRDTTSKRLLAAAHIALGEREAAAKVYRDWLDEEPDNTGAQFLLSACVAAEVPDRAPHQYIESAFDEFAETFDARLGQLGYRAPELVADALRASGVKPDNGLVVLDAGCGTGLCAPLIAPYAARLCGVDLSARMLERAAERGLYHGLAKAELTAYLRERRGAFDAVISADTLVYFGTLEPVFEACYDSLIAEGLLIFTVEVAEGECQQQYRLNPQGRYAHSRFYLLDTLMKCGFETQSIQNAVLRMECGVPVQGFVVTARKERSA